MKAPLLIGSAGLSFCPNSADVIMNSKTNVYRYFLFLICNNSLDSDLWGIFLFALWPRWARSIT